MNHQLQQLPPAGVEIVQSRVAISWTTVEEYAHDMREGATFPPIRVRHDGETYWCGDGCHRIHAARQSGQVTILADVEPGDRRDAVLDAAGANADHGLRRSNEDKRRAVEMLLQDEEWSQWSDHEIARRCKVSQPFVSKMRNELSENVFRCNQDPVLTENVISENVTGEIPSERKAIRNGTVYTVDTAGISRSNRQRAAFDPSAPREQRIADAINHLPATNRPLALSLLRRYGANYGDARLNAVLEELHTGRHDTIQKAIIAATQAALTAGGRSAYDRDEEPVPVDAATIQTDVHAEKMQTIPVREQRHRQPAPRPPARLRPSSEQQTRTVPLASGNGERTVSDNGPAGEQVVKQITGTLGQALLDGHPDAWRKLAARLGVDAPEGTEAIKLAAVVAYRVLWGDRAPTAVDVRNATRELQAVGIPVVGS